MNIIVHLMFSYKIRKIIRMESGIKLNLLGFMYGNILPDISAGFNGQPHNIGGSLNYIVKRAQDLYSGVSVNFSGNRYKYSKNLGVITHYLSDYFCYPHQDNYDKGLTDHGIYELVMIAKYRRGLMNYRKNYARPYYFLAPEDFQKWILERHRVYKYQENSCENDISHAIYAGSMIGRNMLRNEEMCLYSAKIGGFDAIGANNTTVL